MPIYAYRCQDCGFTKDVLQKMSDTPLVLCPECNHETFTKQLTAPGFQLKGSGWYATDFKGNPGSTTAGTPPAPAEQNSSTVTDAPTVSTAESPASANSPKDL